jgi:hypothetical protein
MQTESRIIFDDPSAGLMQVDTRDPKRAETRYLFQAANLLDPEHIAELDYMRGGGDEIGTPCMRRSINGFLPRATLFPLEVWGVSIPGCHLPDGAQDNVVKIVSAMTPETLGMNDGKVAGGIHNLYTSSNQRFKMYPGEEMGGIVKVYGPRGVVEVKSLQGYEWWEDEGQRVQGAAQILNNDFFPFVPVQLSKVEELIDKSAHASELHRQVSKDLLKSCTTARRYMQAELGVVHTLLKQRVSPTGGYAYSYSANHRSYLEQLEMQPQDIENSDVMMSVLAKLADRPEQTGGATPQEIAAIAKAVVEAMSVKEEAPKNKGGRPKKEVDEN